MGYRCVACLNLTYLTDDECARAFQIVGDVGGIDDSDLLRSPSRHWACFFLKDGTISGADVGHTLDGIACALMDAFPTETWSMACAPEADGPAAEIWIVHNGVIERSPEFSMMEFHRPKPTGDPT